MHLGHVAETGGSESITGHKRGVPLGQAGRQYGNIDEASLPGCVLVAERPAWRKTDWGRTSGKNANWPEIVNGKDRFGDLVTDQDPAKTFNEWSFEKMLVEKLTFKKRLVANE